MTQLYNIVMLNVIMLSFVMLSILILKVAAPIGLLSLTFCHVLSSSGSGGIRTPNLRIECSTTEPPENRHPVSGEKKSFTDFSPWVRLLVRGVDERVGLLVLIDILLQPAVKTDSRAQPVPGLQE
jgi:hypothetical protein